MLDFEGFLIFTNKTFKTDFLRIILSWHHNKQLHNLNLEFKSRVWKFPSVTSDLNITLASSAIVIQRDETSIVNFSYNLAFTVDCTARERKPQKLGVSL